MYDSKLIPSLALGVRGQRFCTTMIFQGLEFESGAVLLFYCTNI
jgi:hypothetical protein